MENKIAVGLLLKYNEYSTEELQAEMEAIKVLLKLKMRGQQTPGTSAKTEAKPKTARSCKRCGKLGHNSRTCCGLTARDRDLHRQVEEHDRDIRRQAEDGCLPGEYASKGIGIA